MVKKRAASCLGLAAAAAALAWWWKKRRPADEGLPNQGVYRLYAPVYDRVFGPLYVAARRRTAGLLALQPGESLLISGVGTGLDLNFVPAGVDVLGVDVSAEMLAL